MAKVISPQAPPSGSCSLCTRTPDRAYRAWTRTAGGQGGRTWVAPPCEARRSPTGAGCLQGHCLTRVALSSRPRDRYAPAHKISAVRRGPQREARFASFRLVPVGSAALRMPLVVRNGPSQEGVGGHPLDQYTDRPLIYGQRHLRTVLRATLTGAGRISTASNSHPVMTSRPSCRLTRLRSTGRYPRRDQPVPPAAYAKRRTRRSDR
jgi:hypothetical protein